MQITNAVLDFVTRLEWAAVSAYATWQLLELVCWLITSRIRRQVR